MRKHNNTEITMHFSHQHIGNGSKFSKMAIVTVLHIAVGAALIHNMNRVHPVSEADPGPLLVEPVQETPVKPPDPPKPFEQQILPPPTLTIPKVEVDVMPPPNPVLSATVVDKPVPQVIDPVRQVVTDTPPVPARPASTGIRSAVLADAAGCVKPDYPARAARIGETGTVSLALLVGVDGRVSDARVEKSSGSRDLDRAAVSALSMCKFKPATNGGVAEPAWAQIAYVWTLD
jgi:protein TonB